MAMWTFSSTNFFFVKMLIQWKMSGFIDGSIFYIKESKTVDLPDEAPIIQMLVK